MRLEDFVMKRIARLEEELENAKATISDLEEHNEYLSIENFALKDELWDLRAQLDEIEQMGLDVKFLD